VERGIHQAATEGGKPSAMYAFGVMSEEESDETVAFRWYELAAEHGHAESMRRLGDMYAQGATCPRTMSRRLPGIAGLSTIVHWLP